MRGSALVPVLAAAGALLVGVVAGIAPGASGGYVAKIANSTNTVASAPYFTCAKSTAADKASAVLQLPLTEASGSTTAADSSGNSATGTYQSSMTTLASPGACSRDGGTAYVLNGSTSYVSTGTAKLTNPTTFTLEVWFRTSTASGKLMGFGTAQTGSSGNYDRQLYVTTGGLLAFGIYMSGTKTLTTPAAVTDGAWHQVIATLAPSTGASPGMALYLDGRAVASNAAYTTPENTSGWWRIGYDNQSGWPDIGSNAYFTGALRYAAVYSTAFTPSQVANHYAAGR